MRWNGRKVRRGSRDVHAHVGAPAVQPAGLRLRAAAIAAGSTDYDPLPRDRRPGSACASQMRQVATGVFHHLDQLDLKSSIIARSTSIICSVER